MTIIRLAAAVLLVAGTIRYTARLLTPAGPWPPGRAALQERAARRGQGARLAAVWARQLKDRKPALLALRRALAAGPGAAAGEKLAGRVLALLDSGRWEADLRAMARLGPEARRMEHARRLGPLLRGSRVEAEKLGEALGRLAAQRFTGRAADRGSPLVLDAFREELAAWLARSADRGAEAARP